MKKVLLMLLVLCGATGCLHPADYVIELGHVLFYDGSNVGISGETVAQNK